MSTGRASGQAADSPPALFAGLLELVSFFGADADEEDESPEEPEEEVDDEPAEEDSEELADDELAVAPAFVPSERLSLR